MDNPTRLDPSERFLILLAQYFDGALDATEAAELSALLREDSERRREFADYGNQVARFRELAITAVGPVTQPARVAIPPRPARRPIWVAVSAAAAVVIVVGAMIAVLRPSTPPSQSPAVIANVEPGSRNVRVVRPDGQIREAGDEIRSGDTVHSEGPSGAIAIRYPDGTRLSLVGDTAVTCSDDGEKFVRLHEGTVVASVRPQPVGSPLIVETSAARVEVIGTEFTCQASADRMEVSVTRGRVRVVRARDGVAVEVTDRQRVVVSAQDALAVEPVRQRGDTWDLDFEDGLPVGLHRGRFVSKGLPPGSKGGVASVPAAKRDGEGLFEIASPEMWHQGLFEFHSDSHLHVTYAMSKPGWVNVFICARGPETNGRHVGNYLFNDDGFYANLRPGQWRTASVPLSKLRRAGIRDDKPPAIDEVPYLVLFSSQGDRGLVIDRVWVTRGGPGVVRYQDVE